MILFMNAVKYRGILKEWFLFLEFFLINESLL